MKRIATISAMAALAGSTALAQDVPQAGNQWFTDAQSRLEAELAKETNTNRATNVILMISDGNGVGTNYMTRLFAGQQAGNFGDEHVLPQESFPNLALVKTYNVNAQTPDSAGTGTAMMTGVKTDAGVIGVNEDITRGDCSTLPGTELRTIAEIADEMGKSVGFVSTARITHATPASGYAKSADRNWEDDSELPEGCDTQVDIASQLLEAMEAGRVDVAMGGGRRHFVPEGTEVEEGTGGRRTDGRNLIEEAQQLGAYYAWNDETFAAAPLDGETPLLGLFEASHMQYEADRADEPALADMVEAAVTALSNNEEGFFLQVEAGRVDHANHAGNAARVVRDGVAFAEAVARADELTDDSNTLIIVTADHEHAISFNGYCGRGSNILGRCMVINAEGIEHTGEPEVGSDGLPFTVVGYLNGPGSVLIEQEDGTFSGARPEVSEEEATDIDYVQQALVPKESESHSGEDVAVFAKGPFAHLFDGVVEQNYIFHVMQHAVNAE